MLSLRYGLNIYSIVFVFKGLIKINIRRISIGWNDDKFLQRNEAIECADGVLIVLTVCRQRADSVLTAC